jgi:hypothetical protein
MVFMIIVSENFQKFTSMLKELIRGSKPGSESSVIYVLHCGGGVFCERISDELGPINL